MSDDISNFWRARFERQGHTGWTNNIIYEFDQSCRRYAFRDWLEQQKPNGGIALDFGCGSGDFATILGNLGWSVVAYDKFVAPKGLECRSIFVAVNENEVLQRGPYDLIVCVTVLDHIMDDAEFIKQLHFFQSILKPAGKLFLLEYSPDYYIPPSAYQTFRQSTRWNEAFARSGLELQERRPFFHPELCKIDTWERYHNNVIVRLIARIQSIIGVRNCVNPILNLLCKRYLRSFPYLTPQSPSPLHIMILVRSRQK